MNKQKNNNSQTNREVRIRFTIACPQSGSTLFMRAFSESPQCMVTSRLVFMGNHSKGIRFMPDYSILQRPETHPAYEAAMESNKQFVVCKEELGHESAKGECLYSILPNPEAY
jgi:hypothetical protein